jgi:hypothetical protein
MQWEEQQAYGTVRQASDEILLCSCTCEAKRDETKNSRDPHCWYVEASIVESYAGIHHVELHALRADTTKINPGGNPLEPSLKPECSEIASRPSSPPSAPERATLIQQPSDRQAPGFQSHVQAQWLLPIMGPTQPNMLVLPRWLSFFQERKICICRSALRCCLGTPIWASGLDVLT